MTDNAPTTVIDILKDPATYRKAWFGAAVPFILGLIGSYTDDNHLTVAEILTVLGASLATGGTIFATKNKAATTPPDDAAGAI